MLRPRVTTCLLISALFLCVSFLTFGTTLSHEFVSWDDTGLITENKDIRSLSPSNIKAVFSKYDPELYIPLTFITYQLNYAIDGLNPAIFHGTDILLHTANALLITLLLWMVVGNPWLTLFLGVLFLVHPLNTEAVAWASARKDTLSTFFFLLSIIGYLQYRSSKRFFWVLSSVVLFALGLLSKVAIVTLPLALLLFDWLEGRKDYRRMFLEKLPYFSLSIIFGIVALFGKAEIIATSTHFEKVLLTALSSLFYVWKFIIPYGLSVIYPYTGVIDPLKPLFLLPLIILPIFIAVVLYYRKKLPWLAMGVMFYFLTLVPTFVTFEKGGDIYIASDRYAYIPMIGILLILAHILPAIFKKVPTKSRIATACIVLILASFLSYKQTRTWANGTALYTNVIKYYSNARAAENNLGMEYYLQGKIPEALAAFDRSLAIRDDPQTHINKGNAFEAAGDLHSALKEYKSLLNIQYLLPNALLGIASVAAKQDQLEEAAVLLRKAIELKPDYKNALNNLGAIYLQLGDWDGAIKTFRSAIALQPDFAAAYYNLGGAFEGAGDTENATASYFTALHYNPGNADAMVRLAKIYNKQGDTEKANVLAEKAATIDPGNEALIEFMENEEKR